MANDIEQRKKKNKRLKNERFCDKPKTNSLFQLKVSVAFCVELYVIQYGKCRVPIKVSPPGDNLRLSFILKHNFVTIYILFHGTWTVDAIN